MSDWFDPDAGVVLMHPCDLKAGMRLASRRIDENDRQVTVLTPLWTAKHDSGRTSDGEFHSWRSFSPDSGVRVWAHPEIRPEFMPPHEGTWITNIPSSQYSTEYTDGARTLRAEVLGGRVHPAPQG
ncbi:hypothetical protein [Kitasatospora sp. NPDC098663]|uniref:hypothetical protein n=1 Tax=Kitasatospora sp. NPDC098663 TaxID=3364096 RepID=UPI003820BED5